MRAGLEARIKQDASKHASSLELQRAGRLGDEIEKLQKQASSLRKQLQIQVSTLTGQKSAPAWLEQHLASDDDSRRARDLREDRRARQAHLQECLYRTCAGITMCRIKDPDPKGGKTSDDGDDDTMLGLRIEVVSNTKFLYPYYVMFEVHDIPDTHGDAAGRSRGGDAAKNSRTYLHVRRHTVPPCIPLSGLAARYLPTPRAADLAGNDNNDGPRLPRQNLARFARALRHELLCYHNRLGVVADLRKAAGLGGGKKRKRAETKGEEGEEEPSAKGEGEAQADDEASGLVDISAADAAVRQISMQWADGRTGRLVIDDDGTVRQSVVVGEGGNRDWKTARKLIGDSTRVGELLAPEPEPAPSSAKTGRGAKSGIGKSTARLENELARWLAPTKGSHGT